MKNKLKIQDLDNFQEDLSQEFAAADLSKVEGGMLAETTDSAALKEVSLAPSDELIAYPLPEPDIKPYPLPWPPYPCGCYPYPHPPIKDSADSIYINWCPVIL